MQFIYATIFNSFFFFYFVDICAIDNKRIVLNLVGLAYSFKVIKIAFYTHNF